MLEMRPISVCAPAFSQLTSAVTVYVPFPPPEADQVPPPVAAPDPPPLAGATNVPEPMSVIVSPPLAALADA